jgi:hypothetical protein
MIRFHPRCVALLSVALILGASERVRADDAPTPPSLPAVAATVNGEVIPAQEWLTRMQAVGFNDFNQNLRTRRLNAGQIALEQLVNERLILQYAAKIGFGPSEAELTKEVEAQRALPATKERLDSHQLTQAQLRYGVRYQKTLQAFLTVNQNVSPEEVRAFYDANYGRKWQIGMIRTTKRETAQQAIAALDKGEAFSAVAARLSEDAATKATGGELRGPDGKPRWFSPRDGGLPPQVLTAVDALKNPGDHTAIVEGQANDGTGMAFLIFELLGRFKPNDEDFMKMRPQVEREALVAKALRSGAAEKKLADARKEAKITVGLPGYQIGP